MSLFLDSLFETQDKAAIFEGIENTVGLAVPDSFVMKDLGITTRLFTHWASKGLVINKLRGDYQFKFNFLKLNCFDIVKELREFGFSLEKIQVVYTHLMAPYNVMELIRDMPENEKQEMLNQIKQAMYKEDDRPHEEIDKEVNQEFNNVEALPLDEVTAVNDLYILIATFLFSRIDIRILIDSQGVVFPFNPQMQHKVKIRKLMEEVGFDQDSYISISLMKFFRRFVQNQEYLDFISNNDFLNENELYILSLIKEGKASSITIRFQGQKPTYIEVTSEKKVDAQTRLSEVLLGRGYQDIIIKTQNGNISFTNVTTKQKLNG